MPFTNLVPLVLTAKLGVALDRPIESKYVDSAVAPIRIHYPDGVDEAYVQSIREAAETSWMSLFHKMKFRLPASDQGVGGSDAFDMYIVKDLPAGVGGYTGFTGYVDPSTLATAIGYGVYAHDLKPRFLRGVIAHELFHASQMAYDYWEHISFMEGTATWVVDHVVDDENIYWQYYAYFNKKPFQALNYISLADPYQYGSGLFSQFLDENYGDGDGSLIARLWEHATPAQMTNEPDYFDAIDELLKSQGGLDQAWHDFAEWRFMVASRDDGKHFAEGASWGDNVIPPIDTEIAVGNTSVSGALKQPLAPYSHGFLKLNGNWPTKIRIADEPASTTPSRLRLKWWVIDQKKITCHGDSSLEEGAAEVDLIDQSHCWRNGAELIVAISRFGDRGFDPDTSNLSAQSLRWTVTSSF